MSTTQTTAIDQAPVERLSRGFFDALGDSPGEDAFADDAFFDMSMAVWWFQLQGESPSGAAQEPVEVGGDLRVDVLCTIPTVSGFVTEHDEHENVDGQDSSARRLWLREVRDARIADVGGYCTRTGRGAAHRHAAEAPMIRAGSR
jgi:hypothetical protein